MEAKFLSDENLKKPITEVFELVSNIGKGSYGNVYKAITRDTPHQIVAIKQIPIESDLFEIIREISMMQQCSDNHHIVKYFGSYFHDSDLWIVMEYCAAGSVSDIMKLLSRTLTESQISTILGDTLRGLEYLHLKKKIHRDIKACNILLDQSGCAKLADFGVAGQLSDSMSKRNTVIGTPYWMAPEIIQEIGYDCSADIWSLGITCIEMLEGKPPYAEIHPMRAIFMIPTKPPPTFRDVNKCSKCFLEFVSRCLVKRASERPSASELLAHEFIKNAQPAELTLKELIDQVIQIKSDLSANESEVLSFAVVNGNKTTIESADATMNNYTTLIDKTASSSSSLLFSDGTRKVNDTDNNNDMTIRSNDTFHSMATMVINDDINLIRRTNETTFEQEATASSEVSSEEESKRIRTCIQKEIRQWENDKNVLNGLSKDEIRLRLKYLDEQMEQEIDELRLKYEQKRNIILEVIEMKKKNAQIY